MRERRSRFNRETVAVVGAAALHVLAWWAIRAQSSAQPGQPASARLEADAIEIGFETAARDEVAEPRTAPALAVASRPVARTSPRVVDEPLEPLAELSDDRPALEETAESAPRIDPQSNEPIDLGIGENGWQRWVTSPIAQSDAAARSGREPLVRAPIASATGGLQEGLEARSRALGLGPSGRVVSALRGVLRPSCAANRRAFRRDARERAWSSSSSPMSAFRTASAARA